MVSDCREACAGAAAAFTSGPNGTSSGLCASASAGSESDAGADVFAEG